MSLYSQTLAITLQKQPYREADCFFTIYTRDAGKIRALAAGAKKIKSKLAGHLEPFGVVKISLAHGFYQTRLTSALRQKFYPNIAKNIELIELAGKCLQLTDKLTKENHNDEKTYYLLEELLNALNQNPKPEKLKIIYPVFVLKLLTELGYKPELHKCLNCKTEIKPNGNLFSYEKGGLVCSQCQNRQEGDLVGREIIKLLRAGIERDFNNFLKIKVPAELAANFNQVVERFLEFRR